MENISRVIPIRLVFDCFNEIFDVIRPEIFVLVKKINQEPRNFTFLVAQIIEDKIIYEDNKKDY